MWREQPGRAAVLDKVVQDAVPSKTTFMQRLQGSKRASHTVI